MIWTEELRYIVRKQEDGHELTNEERMKYDRYVRAWGI